MNSGEALYRARLTLVILATTLIALGLAGMGKSLYLAAHTNIPMATGVIYLLLGSVLALTFPTLSKNLARSEAHWAAQRENRKSLWQNAVFSTSLPFITVFLLSAGPRLLGASTAPLFFRLFLGLDMLALLLSLFLMLQQFARLAHALKG